MERDHLEDLGVDEGTTLKWIFWKLNEAAWTELLWFKVGTGGVLL